MTQLRRSLAALAAPVLAATVLATLAGCGAAPYRWATDNTDHAYFEVPSGWHEISSRSLADAQADLLGKSAAGQSGGDFLWARAYSAVPDPGALDLLTSSSEPMVYSTVQLLSADLRQQLSFDFMRDLIFPVTAADRGEAAAEGDKLTGFNLVTSRVITPGHGMRGINEIFEYDFGGQLDAFDQTVLTNSSTTKLYLLLVQCLQSCFLSHAAQIKTVVDSYTVVGP
jgi:hypothetical protein